jgi:CHASE3 domain sensor protein
MLGLRQKLSLGFGGLLVIILIIGIQSIIQLTKLGESIDVILRENYRSVIACQQMKEALERMDSGILFELLGYTQKGDELIRKNELIFEMALQV